MLDTLGNVGWIGLLASPFVAYAIGSTSRSSREQWKSLVLPGGTTIFMCLVGVIFLMGYHGDQGGFFLLIPIAGAVVCIVSYAAFFIGRLLAPKPKMPNKETIAPSKDEGPYN
jgi:peptidoglycan/LPS O-acetylase OafA/YrhL